MCVFVYRQQCCITAARNNFQMIRALAYKYTQHIQRYTIIYVARSSLCVYVYFTVFIVNSELAHLMARDHNDNALARPPLASRFFVLVPPSICFLFVFCFCSNTLDYGSTLWFCIVFHALFPKRFCCLILFFFVLAYSFV